MRRFDKLASVLRLACVSLVIACSGGAPATTTSTTTTNAGRTSGPSASERAQAEREHREEIVATHRAAELEQQTALAASCSEPKPWTKHARCMPSCYPTEAPDPRAGKQLAGTTAIEHVVCRRGANGPYMLVDEIGGAALHVKAVRGRLPRAPRKGSWQAALATWFREEQPAKLSPSDLVIVKGGWRTRAHPLGKERMSCVTVVHYARSAHGALDDCGAPPRSGITCEAAGNAAARAINVVHYRLAEAKRLRAAGKTDACQQAALEAIAVARGLPRWRQYKALNVDEWDGDLVYRTRFDGLLDEDALFAAVAASGSEAEAVHTACGGAPGAPTNVDQEQSFHTCW